MTSNKTKTIIAFYICTIALIMLVAASYAWMSISSAPIVSDLALSLVTENNLEFAPDKDGQPDDENWSSVIDLKDLPKELTTLRPITFSAEDFAFRVPVYGIDGRIASLSDPFRLAPPTSNEDDTHLTSSVAAEAEELSGYLFIYKFWVQTESTPCIVSLTPAVDRDKEIPGFGTFVMGEPEWDENLIKHVNAGNGAENAIRVGIKCTKEDGSYSFAIYEPNSDGGSGLPTYSADANGGLLEGDYKIIKQTASNFTETDPVYKETVNFNAGKFEIEDTSVFKLKPGKPQQITIYIWLEGQDADCGNFNSAGKLKANLQFSAVYDNEGNPITPD